MSDDCVSSNLNDVADKNLFSLLLFNSLSESLSSSFSVIAFLFSFELS